MPRRGAGGTEGLIGYRLLLVGVLLTPASRLMVVPGVGFSIGDVLLLVGALLSIVERFNHRRASSSAASLWPFLVPGMFIIVGVLISGLFHQGSPLFDISSLVLQYAVVLWLLPLAFSGLARDQLERVAWTLVFGFAMSVFIGLTVMFAAPGLARPLTEAGYMIVLAGDRHGLFTGVAEISTLAALVVPLVYYLMISGRIGQIRASFALFAVVLAMLASRVASGVATLAVVTMLLFLLHGPARRRLGGRRRRHGARLVLITGAATGVAIFVAGQLGGPGGVNLVDRFVDRLLAPLTSGAVTQVGSAEMRGALLNEAWLTIGGLPLAGTGPGLYLEAVGSGEPVHVVPVMIWAETGLLPLLGWLVLIIGLAVGLMRAWAMAPAAALAGIATLAGTVIGHMAVPYMYPRAAVLPILIAYMLARTVGTERRDEVA